MLPYFEDDGTNLKTPEDLSVGKIFHLKLGKIFWAIVLYSFNISLFALLIAHELFLPDFVL